MFVPNILREEAPGGSNGAVKVADDDKSTGPDYQAEAEKWKALARKHEQQAKDNFAELEKLKAAQDSSKSDMDRLKESIAQLNERAEKAEREALVAKVAQAKKLPSALASRLSGSSQEELEADADQLIEALGLGDTNDNSDQKPSGVGRPKENLQPGASNEGDETEITPEKGEEIAEAIRKAETF